MNVRDEGPLRLRALAWSLTQVGHRESPPGSNTSQLIDAWAEKCTRNGSSMGPLWTANSGHNWCAVFATGGAHGSVLRHGDVLPCENRISGKELVDDAKKLGTFVSPDELFAGLYELRAGDLIVYKRLDPATGTHTWHSHVCRFIEWADRNQWRPRTVDGNSGEFVAVVEQRKLRDAPGLWGVIRYFDDGETNPLQNVGSAQQVPMVPPTPAAALMLGVDVSHAQWPSRFDWASLGRTHRFVIARACYGTKPDETFVDFVSRARSVGMTVGAYTFMRQTQDADAQLHAYLAQLEAASIDVGDIVPMVDLEDNRTNGDGAVNPSVFNPIAEHIKDGLVSRFGDAGIYCERDTWKLAMGAPPWVMRHPIWTAWTYSAEPGWPDDWAIHQYLVGPLAAYPVGPVDQNRARRLPLIA